MPRLSDFFAVLFVSCSELVGVWREEVHKATFRVVSCPRHPDAGDFLLGILPAARVSSRGCWVEGYFYSANGRFFAESRFVAGFVPYNTGDAITVILDLNFKTVAFQKNGTAVGERTLTIDHDEYYFTFDTDLIGATVSIENLE